MKQLAGAQGFSCLERNARNWQVDVDKADREKTAFTSRNGLLEFKTIPFRLRNAPAMFEQLMEMLTGLNWQIRLINLNEIIVYGESYEEMIANLESV